MVLAGDRKALLLLKNKPVGFLEWPRVSGVKRAH